MTTTNPIASLMPMLKQAADTIAAFEGDALKASTSDAIFDAAEVVAAVAQMVDSFSRGAEVTPDDVRAALAGMDDALAAFDAEIAKQGGDQP